jgi:hypothetical protein
MGKKLFFLLCLIGFSSSALAEEQLIVLCEKGEWEGRRLGFDSNGSIENSPNAIGFSQYLIVVPLPLDNGGTAYIKYGDDPSYTGKIRYSYATDTSGYFIIETKPKDLLEVITIEIPNFNVIYQTTKQLFGLYSDTFLKSCTGKILVE